VVGGGTGLDCALAVASGTATRWGLDEGGLLFRVVLFAAGCGGVRGGCRRREGFVGVEVDEGG
jgi:hypothetical protein